MTQSNRKKASLQFYQFSFLIIITILGYLNSLDNEFMFDDHIMIFGGDGIEHRTFISIFTDDIADGFYRPVAQVPLWICHRLFETNVYGYHTVNLFLYIVQGCLMFWLLNKGLPLNNSTLAFMATLLYTLHPLNNFIVNYITASAQAVVVITLEITTICFLYHLKDRRYIFLIGTSLAFLAALLSHEMALFLPLFLLLTAIYLGRESVTKSIIITAPYFLLAALFYFLKAFYIANRGGHGKGAITYFIENPALYFSRLFELFSWYIQKLLIPVDFIFFHTSPESEEFVLLKTVLLFLILASTLFLLLRKWKMSINSYFLLIFFVGFSPTAIAAYTYYPVNPPFIEPHWYQFYSIGFFLLAARFIQFMSQKIFSGPNYIIFAIVVVTLFVLLIKSNTYWQDQESYSRHWIKVNPRNQTPFQWLGRTLFDKKDYEGAIQIYKQGIKAVGYFPRFLADMGYCYYHMGEKERALKYYRIVLEKYSYHDEIYHYVGQYHLDEKNYEYALSAYREAIQLSPENKHYREAARQIEEMMEK